MAQYSVIIPLYNRPSEIDELLQSLMFQTFTDFEVIVVEDGSVISAEHIISKYIGTLDLNYYFKDNGGPGLARNFGAEKANTGFFIFFDSDCIIPPQYFEKLEIARKGRSFDAFGGPDEADVSFTRVQKAINYSMTSLFTTGGIRGSKSSVEKFHPRSFNMGISREVFEKTGGFSTLRFGEDIDFSIRIAKADFRSVLIEDCFVYHKRRTDFRKFFKQVYNSGVARINLYKRHPESLKILHFFPAAITVYFALAVIISTVFFSYLPFLPLMVYYGAIFMDSGLKNKSLLVACLAVWASFVQLAGYGLGFMKAVWRRLVLQKGEFHEFQKSFYK